MPIRQRFAFERTPRRFVHGHAPVRLYRRSCARFRDHPVHDRVAVAAGARVGRLRAAATHDAQRSIAHAVEKMNRYSDAQCDAGGAAEPSALRLFAEPLWCFLKALILRRYFLYGKWGLAVSWLHAQARFLKLAKRYEARLLRRPGGGR
jgi:hypothetical protein